MPLPPLRLLAAIKAEIAGNYRFSPHRTDAEMTTLITHARALGMDDELTHDMILTANRKAKPISVPTMKQQMEDYMKIIQPRGYPFGFHNLTAFLQFQSEVRQQLTALKIPTTQIRVHGSSLRKHEAQDLDLLAIANPTQYASYKRSFSNQTRADINNALLELARKHHLRDIDLLLVEDVTYFPNRPYLDFS